MAHGLLGGRLAAVANRRGLPELAGRLAELDRWIAGELREFERELATVPRGVRAVQRAGHHLLDLGGKHLRPMCVALAAKTGAGGFGEEARQLAVAVELVHAATLLHDDVVDVAAARRGCPAARTIYGNAASVFAGDWLLVEALRRVRRAAAPALLDEMLAIIEEMILAESLQLERRGRLDGNVGEYLRIAEGKTAALFRWAMRAGGWAGGLDGERTAALATFGGELGVGFQIVDDCLDFTGDAAVTGKGLYADLREGKLTYPLLLALEREPGLAAMVAEAIAAEDGPGDVDGGDGDGGGRRADAEDRHHRAIAERIVACGAVADARQAASERIGRAIEALAPIADGPARQALVTVALATDGRDR
ncbi:MAG TPA: polyprenyl synthetase family protein [Kofleriaceae bacterium]|nr:polyprenyl synthetase family protein [Kofleriaceae bacterium]